MGAQGSGLVVVFPLLYGACFVILLWQAFKIMARGYGAAATPMRPQAPPEPVDRTGKLTIHPELLDSDGELTREDLLTVRFEGESRPTTE